MINFPNFQDKFHELTHYKKQQQKQQAGKIVIFSAIAAFFGAVIALFFSPASGKENRDYVAKKAIKVGDNLQELEGKAEEKIKNIREEMEAKFDDLKKKYEERTGKKPTKKPVKKVAKKAKKTTPTKDENITLEKIKEEEK